MNEEDFYSRQIGLPNFGKEGQAKLKASSVLVIGAGGLGAPVLLYLAAAGVGTIGICDNDQVELSNLHRQVLFSIDDLNKNKACVAAAKIKLNNPWVKVKVFNQKIECDNSEDIIKNFDLIIDCTDNFKTKFLIHDQCFLLKKNLIQSSIYQFEGQLQVFTFSESIKNGCFRCLWPKTPEASCVGNCAEAGVLGVVPGIFGSMQASEALKLILEWKTIAPRVTLIFDLFSMESQKLKWKKEENCPLCGKNTIIKNIDPTNYESKNIFEVESIDGMDHLIDIRELSEIHENDYPKNLNIKNHPLSSKEQWISKLSNQGKILFICQKGMRSKKLVSELRASDLKASYSLIGGINSLR